MFSDPEQNIEQLSIGEGMHIADLGCGTGFYSLAAAKAVGDQGKVYAIDVQKDLLERLKKQAHEEGIGNIETVWGDIDLPLGSKLRDQSVDVVIAANLFFQVEEKKNLVNEIKRILKPDGNVLFVDWSESFGGLGPHKDNVFDEEKALSLFGEAGFEKKSSIQAGEHHYGIIFARHG